MPASDTVATVDVVGITEIAQMLGVSRPRASQLTETKGFPPPAARLSMGPIWRRSAIEKWVEKTGPRKPGRPPSRKGKRPPS